MSITRPFLLYGAVLVLVFTVGMVISHPSLLPSTTDARAWLTDEGAALVDWMPLFRATSWWRSASNSWVKPT